MNQHQHFPVVPASALARLGESHGYRIDGDAACLRATIRDIARAAHERSWALQLWACPVAPQTPSNLVGHLVAEAWLPPLAEFEEESADFDVVAAATPPAGTLDWVMVLVLVAARGDLFDEVHDLASYPRHERFVQPRLDGEVRHEINGSLAHVEVATVANPRDASNLSGTLALEIWALPEPYGGGRFEGAPLAGVVLGTLAGQQQWHGLAFDLAFTPPPPGTWHAVVMLREWNGNGYLTRDFANIGPPFVIAAPVAAEMTPAVAPPVRKTRARKTVAEAAMRTRKSATSKR